MEKFLEDKERKRKRSLRSLLIALFYVVKTGCQWRISYELCPLKMLHDNYREAS